MISEVLNLTKGAAWPALAHHLWQSTACLGLAVLLTSALRRNRAYIRYWVWLAASAKFLLPFSALVYLGERLGWRLTPVSSPLIYWFLEELRWCLLDGAGIAARAAGGWCADPAACVHRDLAAGRGLRACPVAV